MSRQLCQRPTRNSGLTLGLTNYFPPFRIKPKKKNYRRGSPGTMSSFKKVRYALWLLKLRKEYYEKWGFVPQLLSYRSIAIKVGVFSPDTIMRWAHLDMSEDAIRHRLHLKSAPRKFNDMEEKILAGWVIYKDLTLESSTTQNFHEFAFTHFGKKMSPSYITCFMYKYHLSLKLVGTAKRSELQEEMINEAVNFLETFDMLVKLNNLQPSQIKVMDKTYLITSPWHKHIRHLAPSGSNKPRKQTPEKGTVHEIWTTLSGDGKKGDFYVQTKSLTVAEMNIFLYDNDAHVDYVPIMKNPKTKKNILPSERGMMSYLHYNINISQFLEPLDFLLFDGELAFQTDSVKNYMSRKEIFPFTIKPSVLHQFINPCDNNFHSLFKLSYYRLLSHKNYEYISDYEKLHLAKQAFDAIDESAVISMFKRCGLIQSQNKREIIHTLMFEGLGTLGKYDELHRVNLYSYILWCKEKNLHHLCSSISNPILRMAGMID